MSCPLPPGVTGLISSQSVASQPLERHTSAPTLSTRPRKTPSTSRVRPVPLPQKSQSSTGFNHSGLPQSQQYYTTSSQQRTRTYSLNRQNRALLHHILEADDMSPEQYLSQSPSDFSVPPSFPVTSSPDRERGEFKSQDLSLLSTLMPRQWQVPYSPTTSTSGVSMTTASTAMSEPMSRITTNEQLSGFDMLRVDSSISQCDLSDTTAIDSHKVSDFDQLFSDPFFPSSEQFSCSQSQSSFPAYDSTVPFLSSVEMKRSSSEESNASSSSSHASQSRMSARMHQQNAQSKTRRLAPKLEREDSSASDVATAPKIIEVITDDGTVQRKAEISRTVRTQIQRKTVFCEFCTDHPQGFHGEHELRRHIDRTHASVRRVWICTNPIRNDDFLINCKACRNGKTYGANYNAAAHLRRTHFNPCQNKRGGRGKVSENRGGKGGGDKPSMEFLKDWMYDMWEFDIKGNKVFQPMTKDGIVPHLQVNWMSNMQPSLDAAYDIYQDSIGMFDLPLSYSTDLVSKSRHFADEYDVFDNQNPILPSQPYPQVMDGSFMQ